VGQGIAHEVDAAALPCGAEHAGHGRLDALVGVDPVALDQVLHQPPIEPARGAIVDVLGARLMAQLGVAQPDAQAFVVPMDRLVVRRSNVRFATCRK
jgi:hypothetical protein